MKKEISGINSGIFPIIIRQHGTSGKEHAASLEILRKIDDFEDYSPAPKKKYTTACGLQLFDCDSWTQAYAGPTPTCPKCKQIVESDRKERK